jgi:hypothetical protein
VSRALLAGRVSSVRRSFSLPVELAALIPDYAWRTGVEQDDVVREALERYLLPEATTPNYDRVTAAIQREAEAATLRGQGRERAAVRLSRELFRSTGLSGEHGDDRGDGEGVAE